MDIIDTQIQTHTAKTTKYWEAGKVAISSLLESLEVLVAEEASLGAWVVGCPG